MLTSPSGTHRIAARLWRAAQPQRSVHSRPPDHRRPATPLPRRQRLAARHAPPAAVRSDGVENFYKDWGPKIVQPVVSPHGRARSSGDWDNQMLFFVQNGYRIVAHDRRGHGRSAQVSEDHAWTTTPQTPPQSSSIWTCATRCTSATPLAAARRPATSRGTASAGAEVTLLVRDVQPDRPWLNALAARPRMTKGG